MKIKMRTNAAGPNIKPMLAGKVYEVADAFASELVKARCADQVDPAPTQASKERR